MTGVKLRGDYYKLGDVISFNAKIKKIDTRYTAENLQIILAHVYLNYVNRDFKLVWFDKRDLLEQLEVGKKFTFVGELKVDNKGELCIHNSKVYPFRKSATKITHRTLNSWDSDIFGKTLKPDDEWELIRQKVFSRDGGVCVRCGRGNRLTVDHIKPKSLGGKNDLDNLQTLCSYCHEEKHSRKIFDQEFDADPEYGKDVKLSSKVSTITEAMHNKDLLKISYTDKDDKSTNRIIEPIDLVETHGRNYLFAFCRLRNDNRHFRIGRIKDLTIIER